jgi:hypothetical protein
MKDSIDNADGALMTGLKTVGNIGANIGSNAIGAIPRFGAWLANPNAKKEADKYLKDDIALNNKFYKTIDPMNDLKERVTPTLKKILANKEGKAKADKSYQDQIDWAEKRKTKLAFGDKKVSKSSLVNRDEFINSLNDEFIQKKTAIDTGSGSKAKKDAQKSDLQKANSRKVKEYDLDRKTIVSEIKKQAENKRKYNNQLSLADYKANKAEERMIEKNMLDEDSRKRILAMKNKNDLNKINIKHKNKNKDK